MAESNTLPRMMSIKEVAKTGLLPEYSLRLLLKQGKLPCIMIGNKALVNFDKLQEQLKSL